MVFPVCVAMCMVFSVSFVCTVWYLLVQFVWCAAWVQYVQYVLYVRMGIGHANCVYQKVASEENSVTQFPESLSI